MSREKSTISDEQRKNISVRFNKFLKKVGKEVPDLVVLPRLKRSTLYSVSNGDRLPGSEFLLSLKWNFPLLNLNWLLTGEGKMFLEDEPKPGVRRSLPVESEADLELLNLIEKTWEVLRSETPYSEALKSNIVVFHYGVEKEGSGGSPPEKVSGSLGN